MEQMADCDLRCHHGNVPPQVCYLPERTHTSHQVWPGIGIQWSLVGSLYLYPDPAAALWWAELEEQIRGKSKVYNIEYAHDLAHFVSLFLYSWLIHDSFTYLPIYVGVLHRQDE